MPAIKVKTVMLDEIHEDPANARKHDQKNLDAIRASLAEFGQVEPLVVQKKSGKVIGGNGRLAALREMGSESTEIVEVDLSDIQATALGIALNRTAELAEWDRDGLSRLLDDLDPDLMSGLAMSPADLESLLGQFEVNGTGLPELPDGDRDEYQQMTFTLHDDQAAVVRLAIQKASDQGDSGCFGNTNSNGNSLFHIAKAYLGTS